MTIEHLSLREWGASRPNTVRAETTPAGMNDLPTPCMDHIVQNVDTAGADYLASLRLVSRMFADNSVLHGIATREKISMLAERFPAHGRADGLTSLRSPADYDRAEHAVANVPVAERSAALAHLLSFLRLAPQADRYARLETVRSELYRLDTTRATHPAYPGQAASTAARERNKLIGDLCGAAHLLAERHRGPAFYRLFPLAEELPPASRTRALQNLGACVSDSLTGRSLATLSAALKAMEDHPAVLQDAEAQEHLVSGIGKMYDRLAKPDNLDVYEAFDEEAACNHLLAPYRGAARDKRLRAILGRYPFHNSLRMDIVNLIQPWALRQVEMLDRDHCAESLGLILHWSHTFDLTPADRDRLSESLARASESQRAQAVTEYADLSRIDLRRQPDESRALVSAVATCIENLPAELRKPALLNFAESLSEYPDRNEVADILARLAAPLPQTQRKAVKGAIALSQCKTLLSELSPENQSVSILRLIGYGKHLARDDQERYFSSLFSLIRSLPEEPHYDEAQAAHNDAIP